MLFSCVVLTERSFFLPFGTVPLYFSRIHNTAGISHRQQPSSSFHTRSIMSFPGSRFDRSSQSGVRASSSYRFSVSSPIGFSKLGPTSSTSILLDLISILVPDHWKPCFVIPGGFSRLGSSWIPLRSHMVSRSGNWFG